MNVNTAELDFLFTDDEDFDLGTIDTEYLGQVIQI